MTRGGQFIGEDLYYRLQVVAINVLPFENLSCVASDVIQALPRSLAHLYRGEATA